jgi:hypothetical protein
MIDLSGITPEARPDGWAGSRASTETGIAVLSTGVGFLRAVKA